MTSTDYVDLNTPHSAMESEEHFDMAPAKSIMILGGETMLGQHLIRLTEREKAHHETDSKLTCLPWSQTKLVSESVKKLHAAIINKRPLAVINCLPYLNAKSLNQHDMLQMLASTHTAIQACTQRGYIYVHATPCAIYGQDAFIEGRTGYEPYDPILPSTDPTAQYACMLERQMFQQVQAVCPDIWTGPFQSTGLVYFAFRFGHLLPSRTYVHQSHELTSLSGALFAACSQDVSSLSIARPDSLISPVSAKYAARCILKAVRSPHKLPSQVFNVGSKDPIALRYFASEVATSADVMLNIRHGGRLSESTIHVGDTLVNQALSPTWWEQFSKEKMPTALQVAQLFGKDLANKHSRE